MARFVAVTAGCSRLVICVLLLLAGLLLAADLFCVAYSSAECALGGVVEGLILVQLVLFCSAFLL